MRAIVGRIVLSASCLKEEPNAALALIDPIFEEAGGGNIACFITDCVDRSHARNQGLLVLAKLTQHVFWSYILCIVVRDAPQTSDVPDGTDGGSTNLTNALGDIVSHVEDLIAVFVEQKVVIPEVRTAHMPMEVLGFEVESKRIRKQGVQCSSKILDCLWSARSFLYQLQ
jgi:hypothetical protein